MRSAPRSDIDPQIALPFELDVNGAVSAWPEVPASGDLPSGASTPAGSTEAFVFARHPRARRYILRVDEQGAVRVTIPRWGSKKEAREFAERERAWIEKQRRKRRERWEAPDGQEAQHGWTGPEATEAAPALRASVEAGRARAKRELPPRLLELAALHGLAVTKVSIRNQKWRWGSCSRSGHICLNWRLVFLPDDLRDYVLIHELMHLKRMDHSPRFWKLVEQACPGYRDLRRKLRASRFV